MKNLFLRLFEKIMQVVFFTVFHRFSEIPTDSAKLSKSLERFKSGK
jgi:hypothetical protein